MRQPNIKLKMAIISSNRTQRQLAQEVSISEVRISKIIHRRVIATAEEQVAISKKLDVEPNILFPYQEFEALNACSKEQRNMPSDNFEGEEEVREITIDSGGFRNTHGITCHGLIAIVKRGDEKTELVIVGPNRGLRHTVILPDYQALLLGKAILDLLSPGQ